ncbi:MAG TPA: SDR family oxidoreductase [Solirubrobacteraceae bacterium]|jgi:glucose 1-dehydrogenase|nr:SDR family oxidoreductase [Solirubrobacteraceae bacterium]
MSETEASSGRLRGRVAIVTGAASGLGRAIAIRFAHEGARVVVSDVRQAPREGGEPTEAEIAAAGGEAIRVGADVSRWEDVDRLVTETVDRFGRLDVMVNNAGIAGPGSKPLLETTESDWDGIMAVNLRGVFLCCKRAVAQMLGQEPIAEVRGRVINISSQHGMVGSPGHVAYCTSKGGVINLTRQVAVDYGRHGVLVNAVAPGKIVTGSPEQTVTDYSWQRTPFSRLGRPDDVAGAAVFLASDDARYVLGTNLLVDGGWMAY